MNYPIDRETTIPAYIQLYRHLVRDIVAGVYPPGQKLPSKRVMAAETGVSVITVEHALDLLEEEGYAEARERSGCFVTYRQAGDVRVPGSTGPAVTAAEPAAHMAGEFPFSVLVRTMRKVLLDYGDRILVKSPNRGCAELREEISRYLIRSRGIEVSADRIVIGSGAEYLYGLIAQLFGKDRSFALEDPSYSKIRKVYEAFGVPCELLRLGPEGIPTGELERSKAGLLHVTPFNSYPSGATAGASKKHEYIRWAERRDAVLVEDNYDSELAVNQKPEDSLFAMDRGRRTVYINTFSKTIAPSMRVGYMLLPESLTEQYERTLGFYSCTVPLFEQYVLAELLRGGDFERHINRVRRQKRKGSNGSSLWRRADANG